MTEAVDPPPPQPKRTFSAKLLHFLKEAHRISVEQWFAIGMGVAIGIAAAWPNVGRSGGAVRSEYTISYLVVAIIFFISGLTIPPHQLISRVGFIRLHLVTQLVNFFAFSAVIFGIVSIVKACDPEFRRFNQFAMGGMVVMASVPTTVSSNVVMTGQAGGDKAAATIEVMIGNLFGTFLSPALLRMYFSTPGWDFAQPKADASGGTGEIYRLVLKQLGCTVFVPLFIGEVLQIMWTKQVKTITTKIRAAKIGSFGLLLIIWSTFSSAFYSGAFKQLNAGTICFVFFVNIGVYLTFSCILFTLARGIPVPRWLRSKAIDIPYFTLFGKVIGDASLANQKEVDHKLFEPTSTIALMFCGPAKGMALGAPIVSIMYLGFQPLERSVMTIPLVLYQVSQIFLGQGMVMILKRWSNNVAKKQGDRDQEKTIDVPTPDVREPEKPTEPEPNKNEVTDDSSPAKS